MTVVRQGLRFCSAYRCRYFGGSRHGLHTYTLVAMVLLVAWSICASCRASDRIKCHDEIARQVLNAYRCETP